MTDIEMMELAAKAAGLEVHRGEQWQSEMLFRAIPRPSSPLVANVEWNPLADDGDALRLAVTLRIDVWYPGNGAVQARYMGAPIQTEVLHESADDGALVRRAITRAAADIGATNRG